ncbi:response regulator transcription factor [Nonomuraea sp. NPDC051191]|uniref:response regulator transcription factor n=1 Tax=Nonomuraea sp. NPDC051191 TaxID=3364372 RepID=UPI00379E3AB0
MPLAPREEEVLTHIAQGFTYDQIARRMGIKKSTVDTHVERIRRKLQVGNKAQLIAAALDRIAERAIWVNAGIAWCVTSLLCRNAAELDETREQVARLAAEQERARNGRILHDRVLEALVRDGQVSDEQVRRHVAAGAAPAPALTTSPTPPCRWPHAGHSARRGASAPIVVASL